MSALHKFLIASLIFYSATISWAQETNEIRWNVITHQEGKQLVVTIVNVGDKIEHVPCKRENQPYIRLEIWSASVGYRAITKREKEEIEGGAFIAGISVSLKPGESITAKYDLFELTALHRRHAVELTKILTFDLFNHFEVRAVYNDYCSKILRVEEPKK